MRVRSFVGFAQFNLAEPRERGATWFVENAIVHQSREFRRVRTIVAYAGGHRRWTNENQGSDEPRRETHKSKRHAPTRSGTDERLRLRDTARGRRRPAGRYDHRPRYRGALHRGG